MRDRPASWNARARVLGALTSLTSLAVAVGCRSEHETARPAPAPPSARAAATPASASAEAVPVAADPFDAALREWNDATNAGDAVRLGKLYANTVELYGQKLPADRAVATKTAARAKEPTFSQTIDHVRWDRRDDGEREANFDKRSHTAAGDRTVRAYLTLLSESGAVHVTGEGDRETDRVLTAKRRATVTGPERFFTCPDCAAEDDPAPAFAPLGPKTLTPGVPAPPGAPAVVEYARLFLERFSSAVDVPLFVTVTPHSGNGDGRWLHFDGTGDDGKPKELLGCAVGGFWFSPEDKPKNATPDAGHRSTPEITSVEKVFTDAEGMHYEKTLYSPERIQNFLSCTFDPRYAAYFRIVLDRSAKSLRVVGGGMYDRPMRGSDPY